MSRKVKVCDEQAFVKSICRREGCIPVPQSEVERAANNRLIVSRGIGNETCETINKRIEQLSSEAIPIGYRGGLPYLSIATLIKAGRSVHLIRLKAD